MNLGLIIKNIIKVDQGREIGWVADKINLVDKTLYDKLSKDRFTAKDLLKLAVVLNLNMENLVNEMRKEMEEWQ